MKTLRESKRTLGEKLTFFKFLKEFSDWEIINSTFRHSYNIGILILILLRFWWEERYGGVNITKQLPLSYFLHDLLQLYVRFDWNNCWHHAVRSRRYWWGVNLIWCVWFIIRTWARRDHRGSGVFSRTWFWDRWRHRLLARHNPFHDASVFFDDADCGRIDETGCYWVNFHDVIRAITNVSRRPCKIFDVLYFCSS